MSCTCSTATFTCNKKTFSMPMAAHCLPHSWVPPVPAHMYHLYCNQGAYNVCTYVQSANYGIGCNAYGGYTPCICVKVPGHNPSCPSPCPPTHHPHC